jgi:hypothetical protein
VHREVTGVLWVATMLVLLFWVWPAPVLDAAAVAAKSLF